MVLYELYINFVYEVKNEEFLIDMAKWIKNLVLSFCFLAVAVFTLAGCGTGLSALTDNPDANDIVTGNGTLAVTKGEYLYFVNSYVGYADVGDTNYDGKITYPALYRIKLDSDGHPVESEPEYDDDGEEIFDGSNPLEDLDVMVQKVVGFEYTGIYIFGDYLYYASPYNGKDSDLSVQSDQIDFFRIKLDRSGGSELIYTTVSAGSSVSYTMLSIDDEVYMVILDGEKLVSINYNENDQKTTKTISEEATGVALPNYTASNQIVSDFNNYIYYTRAINDEDSSSYTQGNILCKYNLVTAINSDKVFFDNNSTITLKKAGESKLYYEKTCADWQNSDAVLYVVTGETQIGTVSEVRVCNSYSTYALADSGNNTVIVDDSTNSALILLNYPDCDPVTLFSGSATIIKVQGDYVYFTDDTNNTINRVNYVQFAKYVKGEITTVPSVETLSGSDITVKSGTVSLVCVDGDKIYYLQTYESENNYLHMIDLSEIDEDTATYYDHFIGVLQEADYDTEETTTE